MSEETIRASGEGSSDRLDGRVVVVTGAGSGIGRAAALLAAHRGARVAALDIDAAMLDETVKLGSGESLAISSHITDVTDPGAVRETAAWVTDTLGPAQGLVCSAGVSIERPFLEMPLELWSKIITLNLTGTFLCAQEFARQMVASGLGGSIVTVSSAHGFSGRVSGSHYAASKAGVLALTKSMALELAKHQIRVNSVAPGAVETPLMKRVVANAVGGRERSLGRIPLGRFGQPDDLADPICFLLSDRAGWITGQTMHINGGSLLV